MQTGMSMPVITTDAYNIKYDAVNGYTDVEDFGADNSRVDNDGTDNADDDIDATDADDADAGSNVNDNP